MGVGCVYSDPMVMVDFKWTSGLFGDHFKSMGSDLTLKFNPAQ